MRMPASPRRHVQSRSLEPLEGRRLMAITYGTNAVLNPGGETFTGTANGTNLVTIANWTPNGSSTLAPWSSGNATSATIPKPADTGNVYFAGGPNNDSSDLFQMVDLSNVAADVDAGKVTFALSALLGGTGSQNDNATVFVNFQDADHFFVDQRSVGPVTAANRGNASGLLLRGISGITVPATTRFAQVQIHFERSTATYNDGYADNVSLVFQGPAAPALLSASFNIAARTATFDFDKSLSAASITANDLQITNLTTNTTTTNATAVSLSGGGGQSVTFTLPTNLADGNYRLRLQTGSISGANGLATTANAEQFTYLLAGDSNRDRTVNFGDLLTLAQNYGLSGRTYAQGDTNWDGTVNFADLLALAQRYGTTLAPPLGGPALSARIEPDDDHRRVRVGDDVLN